MSDLIEPYEPIPADDHSKLYLISSQQLFNLTGAINAVKETVQSERWGAAEFGYPVPSWVVNIEMDLGIYEEDNADV